MGLLNPIWLWGLAGLLVPVGIHLLSRKDMRVIRIGSLRHLEDGTTRQTVRIQPHAYLLLAVRSLIVATVTLLLAGLYFNDRYPSMRWILVESDLADEPVWRPVIDSLVAEGFTARSFQTGFPELNKEENSRAVPDYWSLAEALNRMQLDRCVVITRGRIQGYAGRRPGQDARITWLTDAADSARFVLVTERTAGDTVIARVGRSNGSMTAFETLKIPAEEAPTVLSPWSDSEVGQPDSSNAMASKTTANEASSPVGETQQSSKDFAPDLMRPVKVIISGTNVSDEERHVMRAVLQAIDEYSIVRIQVSEVDPTRISGGDWLIWLSNDVPPATPIGRIIRKASTEDANRLAQPGGSISEQSGIGSSIIHADEAGPGRDTARHGLSAGTTASAAQYWTISQSLTASSVIRNQLTLGLATLLLGEANQKLGHVVRQHDRRVMPDQEMFSPESIAAVRASTHPAENKSAAGFLATALIAMMALERWMANRQQL